MAYGEFQVNNADSLKLLAKAQKKDEADEKVFTGNLLNENLLFLKATEFANYKATYEQLYSVNTALGEATKNKFTPWNTELIALNSAVGDNAMPSIYWFDPEEAMGEGDFNDANPRLKAGLHSTGLRDAITEFSNPAEIYTHNADNNLGKSWLKLGKELVEFKKLGADDAYKPYLMLPFVELELATGDLGELNLADIQNINTYKLKLRSEVSEFSVLAGNTLKATLSVEDSTEWLNAIKEQHTAAQAKFINYRDVIRALTEAENEELNAGDIADFNLDAVQDMGEGPESKQMDRQLYNVNRNSQYLRNAAELFARTHNFYKGSGSNHFTGIGRTKADSGVGDIREASGNLSTVLNVVKAQTNLGTIRTPLGDAEFRSEVNGNVLKNKLVHETRWPKEPRGVGQAREMGNVSANSYYAHFMPSAKSPLNSRLQQGRYEWLHLIGSSLGGPTIKNNLVVGSYDTNTRMIPLEARIANMKPLLKNPADPDTEVDFEKLTINAEATLFTGAQMEVHKDQAPVNIAKDIQLTATLTPMAGKGNAEVKFDRAYDTLDNQVYTPAEYRAQELILSKLKQGEQSLNNADAEELINKLLNVMNDNANANAEVVHPWAEIRAQIDLANNAKPAQDQKVYKLNSQALNMLGFVPP